MENETEVILKTINTKSIHMKTVRILLLAVIATLFCNCSTSNLGLHGSSYSFKQPNIKSNSINSVGLYVSNQKMDQSGL